jgi:hypothetical protein
MDRSLAVNPKAWDPDSLGQYSFAAGRNTKASGDESTAMGKATTASGDKSTAMGAATEASGEESTAMGVGTEASGDVSTAMGYLTEAPSYAETAIGAWNSTYTPNSATSLDPNDRLFVIGNGISTNRSNAMTVLKNGNVGISTTSPDEKLHVVDTIKIGSAERIWDGGSNTFVVNSNLLPANDNSRDLGSSPKRWNDVYAVNGVTKTSDKRAKKAIESLQYGLDELMALNPVTYKTRNAHHPVKENSLGLIAQETQSIIDEVVKTHDWEQKEEGGEWIRKELDLYGINYGELVPVLINSVQEQQKIIDEQKQSLKEQKQRFKKQQEQNDQMKARMKKLEQQVKTLQKAVQDK